MTNAANMGVIAARWFTYRLSVWRTCRKTDADGVTQEDRVKIYDDVPCLIRRGGGRSGVGRRSVLAPDVFAPVPEVHEAYALYAGPEILLEENDEAVITGAGGVIKGNTSRSFVYPSHTETIVNVQKRA